MSKKIIDYFEDCFCKDWHLHDCMSHDGLGTPSEYAEFAFERGINSICITNHVEHSESGVYQVLLPRDIQRFQTSYELILEARERFPEIEILMGIELENSPMFYDAMLEIVGTVNFDFVLGSVHSVNGVNFSGKTCIPVLKKLDPIAFYEGYYLETLEFVEWGKFDILSHGDLIRRNMVKVHPNIKPLVPRDILQDIFSVMIKNNIGLEVNTGGYFQNPKDSYPTLEIIELAIECGITNFTIGSDSHRPKDIGRGYEYLRSSLTGD